MATTSNKSKERPTLFAKNLDFLMANKGVSPEELGEALDTTSQNVNNWLNGRNRPRPEKLKKLANYFEVTPAVFDRVDLGHAQFMEKAKGSFATLFKDETKPVEVNVGNSLRLLEAKSDVILIALSEILAKQQERLSAPILKELEKMVNDKLNEDLIEQ